MFQDSALHAEPAAPVDMATTLARLAPAGRPVSASVSAAASAGSSASSSAAPPVRLPPPVRLALHPAGAADRGSVERFIAGVYARRFGAKLTAFAPLLVSLHDDHGLVAAAGYRPAAGGPLFLERYLPAPVEQLLAAAGTAAGAAPPARAGIVEVGHLAAVQAGAGRRLIRLLAAHLAAGGHDWVVSTMTEELRHLFTRMGVQAVPLGAADPAALGDDAAPWGRYYAHRPWVVAGRLGVALPRLAAAR